MAQPRRHPRSEYAGHLGGGARSRLEIPSNVGPDQFLVAEIHSINAENSHWNTAVRVYLRPSASGYELVGIERDSPEPFTFPMD